jgi:GR25 family glycosyltransferase involved in LPS biosynthesis
MVLTNISSALILEDDAYWNVRLRSHVQDFALSTLALTHPLLHSKSRYADPTHPVPQSSAVTPVTEMSIKSLPSTVPPTISPYGDNWDLLWLGHCGMHFPSTLRPFPEKITKGLVVHQPDSTVAEKQFLSMILELDELKDQYPDHTRVTHHVSEGTCSLGYALSNRGATKLLYATGVQEMNLPYDLSLRQFCDGQGLRKTPFCLTTQPALFKHHRPVGNASAESDISDHGNAYQEKAFSINIRWSARLNVEALLTGSTDFDDQFPDTQCD